MFRRFLNDTRGNFAIITAISIVPIMGALTLGIDYSEMSRQRQLMINSLDAAGIATAKQIISGGNEAALTKYANDFFQANLSNAIKVADTALNVEFPSAQTGGGTLKLCSDLIYHPYFAPVFYKLMGKGEDQIKFNACTSVRLKNTIEVALVLDNSGSMDYLGSGSTKKRIDLLKTAASDLVDNIAKEGEALKQVVNPVQFALVPFAASVNIGSANRSKTWMDLEGTSPVHHENFNWATMVGSNSPWSNKKVEQVGAAWKKVGTGWGTSNGKFATRFSLYDDLGLTWDGCVEARPNPLNVTDETPSASKPESLFVPMFAPDEANYVKNQNWYYYNSWREDYSAGGDSKARQSDMRKYFTGSTYDSDGPNYSCSTKPITPLTNVTTGSGKDDIKKAIMAMQAGGNTNVPEGMAWGWRVLSSGAPFTQGRPDAERGNDKVVIVLTDGANTYGETYSGYDRVPNRSSYAAYGYAGVPYNKTEKPRIFKGTSASSTDFRKENFNTAMNAQFAQLCVNAKAQGPGNKPNVIVMTVALDLSSSDPDEKKQIAALEECASFSRISASRKLFWNATGKDLDKVFQEIANELSNLRIVS
ncbi:hypothetical protein GA830_08950 [Mesorhizobium sp. NBSH29]|uniref:TadE/TadG family type IV pilus assembly protein n=1 Tax=Mesorhizobium sp. NBSH29 TaxID=2654249 RepID=UPI001896987A|nr:TadE/TadG family type IV pilus assembly protein [Mesorhizobium sp. NBSH29]QPC86851.1 hypothetical protein GA830_08950 [Mesorhizobium sp. NBSH29]